MQIIGTGMSGMLGGKFLSLYGDAYSLTNMDLSTGVDITNSAQVEAIMKSATAEVVMHMAAFTDVQAAFAQSGDKTGACYRVNVEGTRVIVDACRRYNKHLIYISTDYVFDGEQSAPYTEADTPNPIEWYGKTKWMAEQIVGEWDRSTILRPAYPYMTMPSRPDFVQKIRERLANHTLPPAFVDHLITPTFADDLALVFDRMIREQPTGIYHCTGSSWHSDYEIATMIRDAFVPQADVRKGSLNTYMKNHSRPYQKTMKIDNSKLENDLGIKMKTFEEGLASLISG